jgi:acetoacetyl-CoA synthetase
MVYMAASRPPQVVVYNYLIFHYLCESLICSNYKTTCPMSILWNPTASFVHNSRLRHFMDWLRENKQLDFNDYDRLWQWSVDETSEFWEAVWQYFDIISHSPYASVVSDKPMPRARWFEGSTLNYAEHVFRQANAERPALIFRNESGLRRDISWAELRQQVSALQRFLVKQGVGKGDRVAAFLPNIPEATIAFLATVSIGAIWSSCSPDFGTSSVVDRFAQIAPKVLIVADGYRYNGKPFPKMQEATQLQEALPSVEHTILVPYLNDMETGSTLQKTSIWQTAASSKDCELHFEPVDFSHPIWVLYSSGTTGVPKAIVHGHGGVLLEHLKYLAFHNDCHAGERFFWFSTTGWMMWNFVNASLLVGATAVLYDGSPAYPDLNTLWKLTQDIGIQHFGTSAPFLMASLKAGIRPAEQFDLKALRSIGSTGSPLPPEGFDYVYQHIKRDVWLCSMSGGTDVCSAFVGGCPLWPVHEGEIQCRALGCSLYVYDEEGHILPEGEMGEMVITKPMPSMPIYFWNDAGGKRYEESYFEMFPGKWRHGDWISITPHKGLVIYGRSDATLNRHGVRIGTSEIYRAVDKVEEVADSLVVNLELAGGRHYMPLFVQMKEGQALSKEIVEKIKHHLKTDYSPRHVPDAIIETAAIPYTISGKKMERPVKRILLGHPLEKAVNVDSMKNPKSLDFFVDFKNQSEMPK